MIHQPKTDSAPVKSSLKLISSVPLMDDSSDRSCGNHDDDSESSPYRYSLLPVYHYHECDSSSPTSTHSNSSPRSSTCEEPAPQSPCYQPEWIYRRVKPMEKKVQEVQEDKSPTDETYWPFVLRPRSKADRSVPILGHTSARPINRRRGQSISSIPSMTSASTSSTSSSLPNSTPQLSRSILTRTSSSSTKNSLVKSVKFADVPTVHIEQDDCIFECEIESPASPIPEPPSPALPIKVSRSLKRFIWPSRKSQPVAPPARPVISSPFALGSVHSLLDRSDAASIRSTRSTSSFHSERASRPKISGPFSLRTARSVESLRSTKTTTRSRNSLRALLSRIVS